MKIILAQKKAECQHVEAGQCEHCKNFRSREAIKKELQWNPFEVFEKLNFDTIITPFKIQRGSLL